jgi:predicted amidohydrolase YtcJ
VSKASIIFKNAGIITMDDDIPNPGMVVLNGERIAFTGSTEEIESFTGRDTKIIDCTGKTLVPGMIDAHCHLYAYMRKLLTLDIGPDKARSITDIRRIIREAAKNTPPGQWIQATGYNEFYLAEKRHPTRWDIDEATNTHPVLLIHRSLHACVLNSMALSLAKIGMDTEEPPGTMIERDSSTGDPNGLLHEMIPYIREKVMPPLSESDLRIGASLANKTYIINGITSLHDASFTSDLARWNALHNLQREGFFTPRIAMMAGLDNIQSFLDAGFIAGYGDDRLRFIGLKIIPSESAGELYPPQKELDRIVLDYYRRGIPLAIHAVTREMVAAAISAFENARAQLPESRVRLRIEHCSECPPELAKRLQKLKPVIVTQPPFVYYNGDRYLKVIPESAQPWLYRFKTFFDIGLTVAAGSDTPVVPDNPIMGIYAAVTRKTLGGHILSPEERISAGRALYMYTVAAAKASGEDTIKGSITPGKLADMVLLSEDPLKADPERLKDIKVHMTIIGGKIVWEDM